MAIERRHGLVSFMVASSERPALPAVTRARDWPKGNVHSFAEGSCDTCSLVPNNRALADEGNRVFGPSHRPQQMNLISTHGWTFGELLNRGKRFKPVPRVSCRRRDLDEELQKYEDAGIPLVVDGWQYTPYWPNHIFNIDYCRQYFNDGKKKITVRNMHTRADKLMGFDDFLEKSRNMAALVEPEETERWYGKDVECPQEWEDWLRNEHILPNRLIPEGCCDHFAFRQKQHGRADVETLMCYFGIADTYTPCHKDLCASSGQNLMCYTERDGSSFWFMTKGSDTVKVTEYFHTLRQELNHEVYTISVEELAEAPFDVYIVEQKLGDLVLVPPRSCHQVINSGGMTIKMSWSRMTLAGLSTALYYELPLYRRVCRPETYQIKSTIYHTLIHYTRQLNARVPQVNQKRQPLSDITLPRDALVKRLDATLRLYDRILFEEFCPFFDAAVSKPVGTRSHRTTALEKRASKLKWELYTCDFCGADIFQSFFHCIDGVDNVGDEGDSFVLCPGCYVEGRTCACREMKPMQRQDFTSLFAVRWEALDILRKCGSSVEVFGGSESLEEQKRYFARPSDCNVFRAAVLLYDTREQQPRKLCSLAGDHSIPSIWTFFCKKCRRAKCFPHLLTVYRMHSIQALLLQEQDASHEAFHQSHKAGRLAYEEGKRQLLKAQSDGTLSPDFSLHMVHNSLTFGVCEPINPTCVALGWYDSLVPSEDSVEQSKSRLTERLDASSSRMTTNRAYVDVPPRSHPRAKSGPGKDPPMRASVPLPLRNAPDGSDSERKIFPASKSQLARAISTRGTIITRIPHQSSSQDEALASDSILRFEDGSELTPTSSDAESSGSSFLAPKNHRILPKRRKLTDSDPNADSESRLARRHFRGAQVEGKGAALGIGRSECEGIDSVTAASPPCSLKRPTPVQSKGDNGSATATIAEPFRKRARREKAPDSKSKPTGNPSEAPEAADFSASLSNALNGLHSSQQEERLSQMDRPVQESTKAIGADSQTNRGSSSSFTPPQLQLGSTSSASIKPTPSEETSSLNSTPSLSTSPVNSAASEPGGCTTAISTLSATLNLKDNTGNGKLMDMNSAELEHVIVMASERVVKQLAEKAFTSPSFLQTDVARTVMAAYATTDRLLNNKNQTPLPHKDSFPGSGSLPEEFTNQAQPIQPRTPYKKSGPKPRPGYQRQSGAGTQEYRPPHKFANPPYYTNSGTRGPSPQRISPEATLPRNHSSRRSSGSSVTVTYQSESCPSDRRVPRYSLQRYDTRERYWTRSRNRAPPHNYRDRSMSPCRQHSDWTNTNSRTRRPPSPPYFRDRSLTRDRVDDTSSFHHRMGNPDINPPTRRSFSQQSKFCKGYFTPLQNRAPEKRGFYERASERPHGGSPFRRTEQHMHSNDHMPHRLYYSPREESGARRHSSSLQQPSDSQGWTTQTRTSRLEVTGRVPLHAIVKESPEISPAQPKEAQEQVRESRVSPPHMEGPQFKTRAARRNYERAEAERSRAGNSESLETQKSLGQVGERDGQESSTASWTREEHASSRSASQRSLSNSNLGVQKSTNPSPTDDAFEFPHRANPNNSEETARWDSRERTYNGYGSPSPSTQLRRAGSESDLTAGTFQTQDRQNRSSQDFDTLQEVPASTLRPAYDEESAAERSRLSKEDQYWEDEYEGPLNNQ